jgi:hypothetical protein
MDCPTEKDLQMQAFLEAAEGIRTLDLLHGKQDVGSRFGAHIPCKPAGSRLQVLFCDSRRSPRVHGGLGTEWAPADLRGGMTRRLEIIGVLLESVFN